MNTEMTTADQADIENTVNDPGELPVDNSQMIQYHSALNKRRPVFSGNEIGRIATQTFISVSRELPLKDLEVLFETHPEIEFIPVSGEAELLCGYVTRWQFRSQLGSTAYSRNLLLKPGMCVADIMETGLAVTDSRRHFGDVSNLLMNRDERLLYHPFVVTHKGRLFGIATVKNLMDSIGAFQSREFTACQDYQAVVLKKKIPVGEHFTFASKVVELDGLGGDFILPFKVDADRFFIAAGDVCGKGLQASNMVTAVAVALKTIVSLMKKNERFRNGDIKTINKIVTTLNRQTAKNTPDDKYASAAFFFVDAAAGRMHYFDFGYSPVYVRRDRRVLEMPRADIESEISPFFGMDRNCRVTSKTIKLQKGDIVFFYSDGINEVKNAGREEFGCDRIIEVMKKEHNDSPERLVKDMYDNIVGFKKSAHWRDDLSMGAFQLL